MYGIIVELYRALRADFDKAVDAGFVSHQHQTGERNHVIQNIIRQ